MKNPKVKGSEFERFISKQLSLFWSGGKRKDLFWRTHSSGALHTISRMNNEAGDIMSINTESSNFTNQFIIECKFYKNINFNDIIYKTQHSNLKQWILNLFNLADKENRIPLLIMKQNHKPIIILTNQQGYKLLHKYMDEYTIIDTNDMFLFICDFNSFLSLDPNLFKSS